MSVSPVQFDQVSVICKANVYFDGKVVSHAVIFHDGSKKTIGLIYAGSYTFNTCAAEKMEIIAGDCKVKIKGDSEWKSYSAGTAFCVPAESAFDISVEGGIAEYVCSYC